MGQSATVPRDPVSMECRELMSGLLGRAFEDSLSLRELKSIAVPPESDALDGLRRSGVATDPIGRLLERSSGATGEVADELRAEYDVLFRADGCIHSTASCWAAGTYEVAGPAWERALDFYRAHGVSVRSDLAHVADHAGFELYVAALLAGRACEARDPQALERAREALRDMLDALLLPWMPEFLHTVELDPRARFYREVARLAREFIEFDWRCLAGCRTAEAFA